MYELFVDSLQAKFEEQFKVEFGAYEVQFVRAKSTIRVSGNILAICHEV